MEAKSILGGCYRHVDDVLVILQQVRFLGGQVVADLRVVGRRFRHAGHELGGQGHHVGDVVLVRVVEGLPVGGHLFVGREGVVVRVIHLVRVEVAEGQGVFVLVDGAVPDCFLLFKKGLVRNPLVFLVV